MTSNSSSDVDLANEVSVDRIEQIRYADVAIAVGVVVIVDVPAGATSAALTMTASLVAVWLPWTSS